MQISQAFSEDESAQSRTSTFGPPYNIIFEAAQHLFSYASEELRFDPIASRMGVGSSVRLNGYSAVEMMNEVLVLTPSKQFKSYLFSKAKGAS